LCIAETMRNSRENKGKLEGHGFTTQVVSHAKPFITISGRYNIESFDSLDDAISAMFTKFPRSHSKIIDRDNIYIINGEEMFSFVSVLKEDERQTKYKLYYLISLVE